ncbi:MAG: DAK2 domain-containing protein [Clostridiales bacterium]|nr:DAK2 domain-containing protein [Clostridiales bacterium]
MTAKKLNEMNAAILACFLQGGCDFLAKYKEEVNALNVFPVPDGDTGINMYLTINSAVKNIAGREYDNVGELGADFAMGALMGARGNSGVILSQIFRGFTQNMSGKKTLTAADFAQALQKGVDLSYKSVMKPVEGTILTVFREFTAAALKKTRPGADIIEMLRYALSGGKKALDATPALLPVLKEAGVVDAGGKGLLLIMEGGLRALCGESMETPQIALTTTVMESALEGTEGVTNIEFIFDIQLLIKGENIPLEQIRAHLSKTIPGDCLLVVGTEELAKLHFHSNLPWQILEYAAKFGSLHDIVIENMCDQHEHFNEKEGPSASSKTVKPCATTVIAVCSGTGLTEVFTSMEATVISGGQSMNPSAEDLLMAISCAAGQEVVLLPNNSNIILTAEQAVKLADKPTLVVPSKFVTQGVSAMLCYDKNQSAELNAANMSAAIKQGISLEVTYAVRNSKFNGFDIKPNDILGLQDGEIAITGKELLPTALKLVEKALDDKEDDYSIISFFYGHDMAEGDAAALATELEKRWPEFDVEYHLGGQPLYYLLMSIE